MADEQTTVTILITGANSGLGFSTCCRLVDEFLLTRPQNQTLHLLFSTRDSRKSADTLKRLNAHLKKTLREANGRTSGITQVLENRIKFEGVSVDLTKLLSVKKLANELLHKEQKLDAVIWNAGIPGWIGLHWFRAIWCILTDLVQQTSFPTFMKCDVGLMAKPQLPESNGKSKEPGLGQVFLSNVLGHYMLTHWIAPLLDSDSRVIWISSTSAVAHMFNIDDFQSIRSDTAYEGTKRLTDYMVLTSDQPSTEIYTSQFFSRPQNKPRMYLVHPGVCGTAISGLPWFLEIFMIAAFYLSRWLGSPWQNINPYIGAVAPAFAALAPDAQLKDIEQREGKSKWGAATGVWGDERIARTETEGWGYCGKPGVIPSGSVTVKAGRFRNAMPSTKEAREEFEVNGRRVWKEMEELRVEWEAILKDAKA